MVLDGGVQFIYIPLADGRQIHLMIHNLSKIMDAVLCADSNEVDTTIIVVP